MGLLVAQIMIISGMALWLSIACLNNIIDRATNRCLIYRMFSMRLLREEQELGQGLISRAINSKNVVQYVLWMIVLSQALIASLLWHTAYSYVAVIWHHQSLIAAVNEANLALSCFGSLWICFLCGGLWFGYWIKMGPVQMTHMTLLMISLLAIIIINIPVNLGVN